jgi:uncharacterized protein YegL
VRALVQQARKFGPEEWRDIKFLVFDCLPTDNLAEPFEERLHRATQSIENHCGKSVNSNALANVKIVEMQRCTGFDHLHLTCTSVLEKVFGKLCH